MLPLITEVSALAILPTVRVPTLVVHHTDDQLVPLAMGKEVADNISGAKFVEFPAEICITLLSRGAIHFRRSPSSSPASMPTWPMIEFSLRCCSPTSWARRNERRISATVTGMRCLMRTTLSCDHGSLDSAVARSARAAYWLPSDVRRAATPFMTPGLELDAHRKGPDPERLLVELRLDADSGGTAHRQVRRTRHVRCIGSDVVALHRRNGRGVELRNVARPPPRAGCREGRRLSCGREDCVPLGSPLRLRGRATSVYDSGARIGSAAATPLIALIIGLFGWRAAFIFAGGLGILWAIGWWAEIWRPENKAGVNEAELEIIHESHREQSANNLNPDAKPMRIRDLFKERTVGGMMLGFFCLNFMITFFLTWFPSYLVEERGFNLLKLGVFGMIPPLAASSAAGQAAWSVTICWTVAGR